MSDFGTWLKKQGADIAGSFGDIANIVGTPFANAGRNFSAVLQNKPIPDPLQKIVPGDSAFYRNMVGVPQEDSLLEIAASVATPFALAKLNQARKGVQGAGKVLRQIQDEAGTKPPVYQFSPSDPVRKGYETLVAHSAGKITDRDFFEQMADHLASAGKLPEKDAKKLKALNTKFGSEGSWEYLDYTNTPNKKAVESVAKEIPTESKFNKTFGTVVQKPITSSDAYKDFVGYKKEDSASRSRLNKELSTQQEIIGNIKNEIADLVEPVVQKNAEKLGYSTNREERAAQLGFSPDRSFVRVDSAFSRANQNRYVTPTDTLASTARTSLQENLKGGNERYHGQFFTDLKGPNWSSELSKYESLDKKKPTELSLVRIREAALTDSYKANNADDFAKLEKELTGSGILSPEDESEVVRTLFRELQQGTQSYHKLESVPNMSAMKNAGFRGFYTDEPGYLKGNIAVFNPSDVRDIRAVFDPMLSWSPNRFAAVGAVPVTDPLLEYFNLSTETK